MHAIMKFRMRRRDCYDCDAPHPLPLDGKYHMFCSKAVVAGAAGPASAGPLFWPTMVSAVPRFSIAVSVLTCL